MKGKQKHRRLNSAGRPAGVRLQVKGSKPITEQLQETVDACQYDTLVKQGIFEWLPSKDRHGGKLKLKSVGAVAAALKPGSKTASSKTKDRSKKNVRFADADAEGPRIVLMYGRVSSRGQIPGGPPAPTRNTGRLGQRHLATYRPTPHVNPALCPRWIDAPAADHVC